ncbi:MAG: hypothetical protein RDV48_03085 [Candidatus Eremiobacteraeota bacterium]|nr:hypothetical protein [Candidatus Eremiobacteraeota bacterium]
MKHKGYFLISLVLLLCLENPAFPLSGTRESDKWTRWDTGSAITIIKGSFSPLRTRVSGVGNLIDAACPPSTYPTSYYSTYGYKYMLLADYGTFLNLRSWILTRNETLASSTQNTAYLQGFTWQGGSGDLVLVPVGTKGFAANSASPPINGIPYIISENPQLIQKSQYVPCLNNGNRSLAGPSPDGMLDAELLSQTQSWGVTLLPSNLQAMDTAFDQKNGQLKYRNNGANDTPVSTMEEFDRWLSSGDDDGNQSMFCHLVPPLPAGSSEAEVKAAVAAKAKGYPFTAGLIKTCDLAVYPYALGGGLQASPVLCDAMARDSYTALWTDPQTFGALSATAPPTDYDAQLSALGELMKCFRESPMTYTRKGAGYVPQEQANDCSVRLIAYNYNSSMRAKTSEVARMGDGRLAPSGNSLWVELVLTNQYNTPKERLFIENVSLSVIYRDTALPSQTVKCAGFHEPVKNYLFSRHSAKEVKDRTFYRVFERDSLQTIRAIYGTVTFSKPKDLTLDDYALTRKNTGTSGFTLTTAPLVMAP